MLTLLKEHKTSTLDFNSTYICKIRDNSEWHNGATKRQIIALFLQVNAEQLQQHHFYCASAKHRKQHPV